MASAIIIICAICSMLVNITEGQLLASSNDPNQTAWELSRSKRSLYNNMPLQLEVTVKYSTGEKIDLCWVKQIRHLANEHLPVMTTLNDFMPNVMTNVGEFVIYHDLGKCSAVVYFEKLKKFYGVIGTDYYVRGLPYHFNELGKYTLGVVDDQYVKVNEHPFVHIHPDKIFPPPSDTEVWEHFLHSTHYNLVHSGDDSIDPVPGTSTGTNEEPAVDDENNGEQVVTNEPRISFAKNPLNDPMTLVYCLETLVIVTRDIAQPFKLYFGEDNYIEWIVRNYIIYFNSVDMIFQKLQVGYAKFSINIARIIIEDDTRPFDFTVDNGEFQFNDVITKLPEYLRSEEFPIDSFDHVFVHTHRKIMDETVPVNGLTKRSGDLYAARKIGKFYEAVSITVARFHYYYADYTIAVHEFGRVLKLRIDPHARPSERLRQCHAIMQREGPKCNDCLKWSASSKRHYELFLRLNRNRCFLLNKPRSLRPPVPIKDVTPHRQCLCYGYSSHIKTRSGRQAHTVGLHGCTKPLECQKDDDGGSYIEQTLLPFDGTQCTHAKVCWHGECIPFTRQVDFQ